MRAQLQHLSLDPEPATLPATPEHFSLLARMIVGPADGPGEESFDITVCTPEWLSRRAQEQGGIYDPRHHLVVILEGFDQRVLRTWLETRVQAIEAPTWRQLSERLARIASWEFEDYST